MTSQTADTQGAQGLCFEDFTVGRVFSHPFGRTLSDQGLSAYEFAQKLCGARPDRTHPDLVAFAVQPDLRRRIESQVADSQVEDFLHTGSGI